MGIHEGGSLKKILVFCAVALLTSVPGFAQNEPESEFSAGYDFLRLVGDSRQSLPSGWYGEIASNVTPMLATVGQMTGHYKILDLASLHTFVGGVRFSAPHPKATLFAQILVGVAILSSSATVQLPANHVGPVPPGLRGSSGGALLQVGTGVSLMRDAPIGIRIGGDFVRIGNGIGNMLGLAAGFVVPFGR